MESFNLGPFAFSVRLGLMTLAVIVAFAVGNQLARGRGTDVERALWMTLLGGLVAGRVAFVMMYRTTYANAPWTMLDIRDGGFNAVIGVSAALLIATVLVVRHRQWRTPLLMAMLSGSVVWGGGTAALSAAGKPVSLPQLALSDLNGEQVRVDSFDGKPMVVNLWATWCPPCRREMPVLQQAQQSHRDIVFVFANQGESAEAIQRYLGSEKLALDNVLLDAGGALARHVGSVGMPTTLFFDDKGKLVGTRVGELSAASLEHRIAALRGAQ